MVMKTFQIFRAGTHTTMAGKDITFTETDLAVMAATYSEAVRPANLVLGHPENDQPAHGTVKKLFLKGSKLYALADAGKALVDLVKAGRYGNVSAAFIPTKNGQWYLRHVGFLGAMPPAVKGMDPQQDPQRQQDLQHKEDPQHRQDPQHRPDPQQVPTASGGPG